MSPDPEADAFVRTILNQPDDTTARLVFADWLDERGGEGDEAWARYIRAQVEAAKHADGTLPRREQNRVASVAALELVARVTVPAELFVQYPRSLIQLLPPPNLAVSLADVEVPLDVVELMPESVARDNHVLPLALQGRTLLIAATNPCNGELIQKLNFILNKEIIAVGCDDTDMDEAIDRHYGNTETESVDSILVDFTDTTVGPTRAATGYEAHDPDAPVSRMVAVILGETIDRQADRTQLVSEPDSILLRYQIGGWWVERDRMPLRLLGPVTERLASLCGAWNQRSLVAPYAGRFPFTHRGFTFSIGVTLTSHEFGPTINFDIPDANALPEVQDVPVP